MTESLKFVSDQNEIETPRGVELKNVVYVNGDFVPANEAKVSVFDRGFLFGDGVYEVIPIINGVLIDFEYFVQRIESSLKKLELSWPCSRPDFLTTLHELVAHNSLQEGYIYLQVTRGVAERDFPYPLDTKTTFIAFTSHRHIIDNPLAETGVDVVTVDDLRWKRRDIKSLNLLAQCMAKQEAKSRDAFEGWMVEDGYITEGASSSAFIVKNNQLITRPLSNSILPGIRRRVILELAQEKSIDVDQRRFTVEEALSADEAFLRSATTLVLPMKNIDGQQIGTQVPGPVTRIIRNLYLNAVLETANSKH